MVASYNFRSLKLFLMLHYTLDSVSKSLKTWLHISGLLSHCYFAGITIHIKMDWRLAMSMLKLPSLLKSLGA